MKTINKNVDYRVGLGQTPSGKILERNTRTYKWAQHALDDVLESKRRLFVRRNRQKYMEITVDDLRRYVEEEREEYAKYKESLIDNTNLDENTKKVLSTV